MGKSEKSVWWPQKKSKIAICALIFPLNFLRFWQFPTSGARDCFHVCLSYNLSLGLKTLAWNVMIHGGFIAWLFKCLVLVCFGFVECRQLSAIHPPCPWTLGPPGAHHIRVEGGAAPRPPQGQTKGGTTLKYYGKTQHILIGIINRIWTNY